MSKPKAVLMFGAPGAGKGTIGAMICNAGGHYHLSTGDIFRGLSKDSENGKLFHSYASKGALVPDDVTMKIWWNYTTGLMNTNQYDPSKQLLVLDGLPRTVEQAKLLTEYVDIVRIIALNVGEEEIFKRIQNRAKIEGRADDANIEIVRNRLSEYRNKTQPVLDVYPEELISQISAEQAPLEVLRDVLTDNIDILK